MNLFSFEIFKPKKEKSERKIFFRKTKNYVINAIKYALFKYKFRNNQTNLFKCVS